MVKQCLENKLAGKTRGRVDFLGDGKRSAARIWRRSDRPPDDEIIGPRANRLAGRRHTLLVVRGCARRPHAGNYDEELRPAGKPYLLRFIRRRNDSVQPCLFREPRQCQSARSWRPGDSNGTKRCRIVAGQDCHPKHHGSAFLVPDSLARGAHHLQATQSVHRHQAHLGQGRRRGYGPGHRVGNIMKLQVEKYPETEACDLLDRVRAFRRKELASYFE